MEIWKILLITLLAAVAGGCIIGALLGRHAVNKAKSSRKPLLSRRERILYLGMLIAGAVCIALAVFWPSNLNIGGLVGDEPEDFANFENPMDGDVEFPDTADGEAFDPGRMDGDELPDDETLENAQAVDGTINNVEEEAAAETEAESAAETFTASAAPSTKPSGGGTVIVRRG